MMKRYRAAALALVAGAVAAPGHAQEQGKTLEVRQSAKLGPYLVDGGGRALYLFTADRQGTGSEAARSSCYDACATAWPPLLVQNLPKAAEAVDVGLLSTIERKGGKAQVTYNGWPLYYWAADRGRGKATGQDVKGFGGEWYLVSPAGHKAEAQKASAQQPEQALFQGVAFKGPECVRYDAARDRYLVSNINGKMREVDDNGFISRLAPDGTTELKWIDAGVNGVELNAPKGMAISGGKLHVADIDHLRTFDVKTGAPMSSVEVEGAKFLNDIAIAPDGTLYVTDTGTKDVPGAIYEVSSGGKVRTVAKGRHLERPNGIDLDQKGNLIVVTYGSDKVLTISKQGKVLDTRKLKAGKLDGLVVRSDGSKLVSSWKGKYIVRISPDGTTETVVTGVRTPAAFDVDEKRQRLVVPLVQENKVALARLQ